MNKPVSKTPRGGYWKGKKLSEEHKRHISEGGKGRKLSDETKQKLSIMRMGDKNPAWKGDDVTIESLHDWVKWHKPKPMLCEECKEKPPFDLANISGEYKRDINDFRWICRKCHMKGNGRTDRLAIRNKSKEARENLRIKKTGKKLWEIRKHPWIGRHHTEESKKKNSETKKRMYATGELIHPWIGRHHTEETKKKISATKRKNKK